MQVITKPQKLDDAVKGRTKLQVGQKHSKNPKTAETLTHTELSKNWSHYKNRLDPL
jgi:hypothetical protein